MLDSVQEQPSELPPLPPNQCVLAVRPAADGPHIILRLNCDVTHLSDDGQKLLIYMLTNALTELEKAIKDMNRIEAAAKLAQFERIRDFQSNRNGEQTTTE